MVRAGAIIPGDRVALIDLRGHPPVPPEILYEQLSAPVAVFVEPHPRGGLRYTVGVNPLVDGAPTSLRPALDALAAAERRHGLPVLSASPTPGSENWGGRSTVFGSPWNHPSRLTPERVVALTEEALATAQRS
jgi:hypothetical protein